MQHCLMRSLISTAACGCIALPALGQQDPPNLIFILTDDMGLEAIRWAGDEGNTHEKVFTDNLEAMSAQGVSFTRCRVNPNCSPTRACLMTGRSALDNGVVGVLGRYNPIEDPGNPCESTTLVDEYAQVTNRLGLQTQERTLGEVLQDMGYYTILIDKWHLGYNEDGEQRGMLPDEDQPLDQGFDVFVDWMDDICDGYGSQDPYYYADFHMLRAMQAARDAVNNRPNPETTPYALFFHTITPHKRHPDSGSVGWWEIWDQTLLVHTKDALGYGNSAVDRFAQNVEALDTALLRELLGPGTGKLGVLDANAQYDDEANTIIFFIGDNGTDASLNAKGKNTLFEGGVRVPLFVMGEGIPGNTQDPIIDDRQISHVDIYETICDIVGATNERDNPNGAFPRRGESFAYNIGYSQIEGTRDITVCSLGNADTGDQVWRVAIVYRPEGEQDDRWKLICDSGGEGLAKLFYDEFYDLKNDPGETCNLVTEGMNYEEIEIYYELRDRLASEWPTAVSVAAEPVDLPDYRPEFQNGDYVLEVLVLNYTLQSSDEDRFYNIDLDPDREHNLLDEGMNQTESALYNAMRDDVEDTWGEGERFTADPNVRVVDVPVTDTLVLGVPTPPFMPPALTIGYKDAGGSNETEFRVFLKFGVSDNDISFPSGFDYGDVVSAQLILHFKHDSQEFNPNYPNNNTYMSRDTDTEVINVYKMLGPWTSNPWDNYDDDLSLGSFDPPPHIIAIPFSSGYATKIRMTPMPQGTPVSFGRNGSLKNVIDGWRSTPSSNHGVILVAEELPMFLSGTSFRDQQVTFQSSDAVIRLTLDRDP